MWYLLIGFLLGILYGYTSGGKTDKSQLFWRGVGIAVVLAILIALVGWVWPGALWGVADMGFWGFLFAAVLTAIAFVLGTWLGDMLEGRRHGTTGRRARRV